MSTRLFKFTIWPFGFVFMYRLNKHAICNDVCPHILCMLCIRTSYVSHNNECLVKDSCRFGVWVICSHVFLIKYSHLKHIHMIMTWNYNLFREEEMSWEFTCLTWENTLLHSHIRLPVRNVWFRDHFSFWMIKFPFFLP